MMAKVGVFGAGGQNPRKNCPVCRQSEALDKMRMMLAGRGFAAEPLETAKKQVATLR